MNKFKLILTSFIPFLVFVGCGQHFKANSMSLQEAEKDVNAANLNIPEGTTPKSVDQQILDNYMSEFNGLDSENIQKLISDIRSFEIQVDRTQDQLHSVLVRIHSRTNTRNSQGTSLTACDNLIRIRDSQITLTQLQSQNSLFLGRSTGYEVMIQCTDSRCNEMVAAIRRVGNGPKGLILMGLIGESITGGRSGSYTQRYVARDVDIKPYFTVAINPDRYISKVCSLDSNNTEHPTQPQDEPVDPLGDEDNGTEEEEDDRENSFWFGIEESF